MKLSNSSLTTLQSCGMKYKYAYVDKLTSIWMSSALKFGSAIDTALNHLLLNKDSSTAMNDAKLIFEQEWTSQKERNGKITQLETNPYLIYSKTDFDKDLLDDADVKKLEMYYENWDLIFEAIKKKKDAVGWGNVAEKDRSFFNYVNWLSLRQKGRAMVEAYHKYILPEITEVLDVQKHISADNGDGTIVHGYVDLVVRLKDGTVAVLDNKTATRKYEENSAAFSPQLTLYMLILNNMPDIKYKVEKVGYAVLLKSITKQKTKVCQKCKYQAETGTTHKTCNNEIDGKRCGGKWDIDVKKDVDFQLIVSTPTQKFQEDLLTNVNQSNKLIQNGLFIKNYSSCVSPFGRCDYWSLCHEGKMSDDLKLKEE